MKFTKPTRKLAKRIRTEVEFDERITGYRLRMKTGPMPVALYSFKEVVQLLDDPHPRIDFNGLEQWIRNIMGDNELADKIGDIIKLNFSGQDKSHRIKDLMQERLRQCKG